MRRALDIQVAGRHYKDMKIQPVEYIMANDIPYMEGNVIKYVSRWRDKGGVEDLKKARHYLDLLIENEERETEKCDDTEPCASESGFDSIVYSSTPVYPQGYIGTSTTRGLR